MQLSDEDDRNYPEHDRSSCSDEDPCNADIEGHGCRRCNAFAFQKAEDNANEVKALHTLAAAAYKAWDADNDVKVGKLLRAMLEPPFRTAYLPDLEPGSQEQPCV